MPLRFLLCLLLGLTACAEQPTPNPPSDPGEGEASAIASGFEKISLARTGCYGFCPTYEVILHADGLVEYQGYEHVGVIGSQRDRIAPEQLAEIIVALEGLDFLELQAKYEYKYDEDGKPYTITDQPSRILTLTVNGVAKEVEHYFGGPEGLPALADLIDQLADTQRWTKKADE